MAWTTGVASDHLDLLGRLRDFLTTNSALVAASQNWTRLSGPATGTPLASDELVLRGPGLTNSDDIRVGFKVFENAGAGFYNLGIVGLTNSGVNDVEAQPGASLPHWMLLLNSPMTYWFIANGRRFYVIVRTGSSYQQMTGGFILPEHLPDDWPYPLYVGACAFERNIGNSNGGVQNSAFWNSFGGGTQPADNSCGSLCDAGRVFRRQANYSQVGNNTDMVHTGPWSSLVFDTRIRQSLTDQPTLVQGFLFSDSAVTGRAFYGRFDGLFFLPAFGVVPEQIVTIGGVDHLAIPNVFRTNDTNFCAYALQ